MHTVETNTSTDAPRFTPMEVGLKPNKALVIHAGVMCLRTMLYHRPEGFQVLESPAPLLRITSENLDQIAQYFGDRYQVSCNERPGFVLLIALRNIRETYGSYARVGDWVDNLGMFYQNHIQWKPIGTHDHHFEKSMGEAL